jgi:hypothetical protein
VGGAVLGATASVLVVVFVYGIDERDFVRGYPYFVIWYALIDLLPWLFLRMINRTSALWYLFTDIPASVYCIYEVFDMIYSKPFQFV